MNKLNFVRSRLAEGISVNVAEEVFSWVDIFKNEIYLADSNFLLKHKLKHSCTPSNIFYCDKKKAIILDEKGISEFYWENQSIRSIYEFSDEIVPVNYRTNDGVMLSSGTFLFGTMHKSNPKDFCGKVWLLKDHKIYKIQDNYIPNSFIVLDKSVLIADSFKKLIYEFSTQMNMVVGVWLDYGIYDGTPDGGFYSNNNFCYFAVWGDSKIIKVDKSANIVSEMKLPFKYPTNCKEFKEKIIITSASDQDKKTRENEDENGYLYLTDLF